MKNYSFRLLSSLFIAWTFIFQSVAFAADPIATSTVSNENKLKVQRMTEKISNRYSQMSDKKKLKLLKRTERKLKRNLRKLENMSDAKFARKFSQKLKTEPHNPQAMEPNIPEASVLSNEENEVYQDLNGLNNTISVDQNIMIEKFQMIESVEKALHDISEEKINLEYKLSNVDVKNDSSRMPASINGKTWETISYALLIGLAIASFFTPIALYILLGIVAIAVLAVAFLFIVIWSLGNDGGDIWPWT